jgi:hypothetical protein
VGYSLWMPFANVAGVNPRLCAYWLGAGTDVTCCREGIWLLNERRHYTHRACGVFFPQSWVVVMTGEKNICWCVMRVSIEEGDVPRSYSLYTAMVPRDTSHKKDAPQATIIIHAEGHPARSGALPEAPYDSTRKALCPGR